MFEDNLEKELKPGFYTVRHDGQIVIATYDLKSWKIAGDIVPPPEVLSFFHPLLPEKKG